MSRAFSRVWRLIELAWINLIIPPLVWALGYTRTNRQTVFAWPEPLARAGQTPLGPRVALFVHFDAAGAVRGYVLDYVRALRAEGLDVAFVSNSGRLREEALEALKPLAACILVRRNIGYDFGAWQDSLSLLGLPRVDTEMVVLANDSVYGPLARLDRIMSRVDFALADLWGLTESWQTRFHLQSYFVAAGARALRSQAWRDFWAGVRPVPSKQWVIRRYEIGLSQRLLEAGLRCRAIWRYGDLVADLDESLFHTVGRNEPDVIDPVLDYRRAHARHIRNSVMKRVPLNPTSDLWRQLLDAGYPFIKRELLRFNPSDVPDVADWRAKLAELQMDPSEIERDLQRALRGRAP